MNFCPDCGRKLVGDERFCPDCGYNFGNYKIKQKVKQPSTPDQDSGSDHEDEADLTNEQQADSVQQTSLNKRQLKETFPEPNQNPDISEENSTTEVTNIANSDASQNEKPVKKKITKHSIFFIIIFSSAAIFFVVSLILAIVGVTPILLLVSAVADLVLAFVLYKIGDLRERYTCPVCGTKRVKHRSLIRTDEQITNSPSLYKKTFTHVYWTTYVCPKCGEEYSREEKSNAGYIQKFSSGRIEDKRIPPREF